MPDSDLQRRVLTAFQAEFKEQMQGIRAMLQAWPNISGLILEEAFRMAHSMKGSARVCDMAELEDIAHRLENLLSQLTKGEAGAVEEVRAQIEDYADAAEDAMAEGMNRLLGVPVVAAAVGSPPRQDTLRISTRSLDQLVQTSGQLVTEAARQETLEHELTLLARDIESLRRLGTSAGMEDGDYRAQWRDMTRRLQQARRLQQRGSRSLRVLSRQAQESVRDICMLPAGTVFEAFPKMMRDISAEMGKPVRFTMTGGEHEADRAVLQALKDPVMHALRNALSHGIEPAAQRRAAGKSETAEVTLHVNVTGNRLLLKVQDDGRGVDVQRVREKAVERGLVTAAAAAELPPEELINFIFSDGFSTSREVTTVAGRGVGLSVVRERVAHLQGSLKMASVPGAGSTLEIDVPVTISTHWLLLVRAMDHDFAVPARAIQSLERLREVHEVEGKSIVMWRDRPVPLTTVAEAAGLPARLVRTDDGHIPVVILEGANPLALHVEVFVGQINALIRPLPFPASRSTIFAGGVLTEDGTVVPVVNVETVMARFRGGAVPEEQRPAAPAADRQRCVLVVDDSFTARTLQKSILETAGYLVRVAVDGRAALEVLRMTPVDVVVSDVQMPHMDGFELLATMKNQVATAEIPVVLVTSLGGTADRERGLSLGADAYIVKDRFDHEELLTVVRQLVR